MRRPARARRRGHRLDQRRRRRAAAPRRGRGRRRRSRRARAAGPRAPSPAAAPRPPPPSPACDRPRQHLARLVDLGRRDHHRRSRPPRARLEGARAAQEQGLPARARKALGPPAPMRSPRPAATRMASVSMRRRLSAREAQPVEPLVRLSAAGTAAGRRSAPARRSSQQPVGRAAGLAELVAQRVAGVLELHEAARQPALDLLVELAQALVEARAAGRRAGRCRPRSRSGGSAGRARARRAGPASTARPGRPRGSPSPCASGAAA